eukprot:GILK01008274.1.p1 GENE.GILK01008274.1~~GILK01008274.1.p1  ORF type:complete len:827 (-),score=133.07 GILK01008274.1:315-2795(-)
MTELHVLICEAAARAISAFVYYECWVPNDKRTRLLYAGGQSLVADNQNLHQVVEFKKISERFVWERGTGAPGRVWKLGSIEWQVDVSALPVNMFLRNSYAREANLKAMLAIPIASRLSPEFVAVGVFFLNLALEYNSRMVEKMVSVVRQLMENNNALPNISQCSMTIEPVSATMAIKLHDRRSIEVIKNILRHPVVVRTATEIRMLYDFLDGTCCLEQFSERQRWELCRGLTLRELQAGEVLYRMGEMGNESYFILTGILKMQSMKDKSSDHRVTSMDPELQTCILSAQHTNVFFGKKGLNGSTRAETVTAIEPCDLMVMHRTDYDRCTSVNVKELTFNELAQYFHLSMNDASKELGVCVTVLKKVCRDLGVVRWPYRKVRSLDAAITDLERNLALCLAPQAFLSTGESIAEEEATEKAARIRIEIFDLKIQKLQLTKDMSCLNFSDEVDAFGTKKAGSKSIHIMPLNYIRPELTDGSSKKKSTSEDHLESIHDPDLDHLRKVSNQNRALPVPVPSLDAPTPLGSHFGSAFSEISPSVSAATSRAPRTGAPTQFTSESTQPFNSPYFNQPFHPSNYPPGAIPPLFHPPLHTPHNSHLLYNPSVYQSNGSMLFNQNQPFQPPPAGPSTVAGPFDIQTLSAAAVLLNSLGVQTPALPEPARVSVNSIPPSVFQNLAAIFNGLAQQNSNANMQTQQQYPSATDRSFSTGVVGTQMNGYPSQHNGFTGYNPMAGYPMPVQQYGSVDSFMNQMNRFDNNSRTADVPVVPSVRTSSTTFDSTPPRSSPFDLPSEVQISGQPFNKRPRLDSASDSPSKIQRLAARSSSEESSS